LEPQHRIVPSERSTQVWEFVESMAVVEVTPLTGTGVVELVVVPLPN
jgi:hypothetical protein